MMLPMQVSFPGTPRGVLQLWGTTRRRHRLIITKEGMFGARIRRPLGHRSREKRRYVTGAVVVYWLQGLL